MNHPLERSFRQNKTRLKLWEININYHCSIIGTCLTLEEVRKILTKNGYPVIKNTPDYTIHGTAVANASGKNSISRSIQKTLENKYKREISEFSGYSTEHELEIVFNKYLKKGNIPGTYWAVMTHPHTSDKLLRNAFGAVHMLSHINGSSRIGNIERVKFLESEVKRLESEKKNYKKTIKDLERTLKKVSSTSSIVNAREEEITYLQKEIEELRNGETLSTLFNELFITVNMYETERHHKEKAEKSLKTIQKEFSGLNEEYKKIKTENENLKKEQFYLEKELQYTMGITDNCGDCTESECQSRNITGKSILYVGGKSSVIPHCRAMVEKKGGMFIHHDGGMEDNFSILHNIIGKTDAVFCPLDCVSHNACQQIKKICKQNNKEFKLLRSSGLSSFSRELNEAFNEAEIRSHVYNQ